MVECVDVATLPIDECATLPSDECVTLPSDELLRRGDAMLGVKRRPPCMIGDGRGGGCSIDEMAGICAGICPPLL